MFFSEDSKMRGFKTKLLLVCALTLFVGAPAALGHWNPGDGHKMHFPQMPDPCGWDVAFWNDVMFVIPLELADDWRCSETGPVEDIHFWVSWKGGSQPGDIGQVIASIYSNDPCGTYGWSEPNELLWQQTFMGLDNVYYGDGWQGWYNPLFGGPLPLDHYGYYQINITDIAEPFIQEEDQIYWLSIQLTPSVVGWKTSLDHFEDNAVWRYTFDPCSDPCGWGELYDPGTGGPLDFAFVITGEPEEPPPVIKWEQPPDPCNCGLDALDYNFGFGYEQIILADDWLCEGGVVTDLHWWGTIEDIGAGLMGFHLSIHDNYDPCCLPLDPALWEADIPIGSITVTPTGVFNNCGLEIIKYEYFLPAEDHFDQEEGETYWFNLSALSSDPCNMCVWSWQEAGRSTTPILCPAADKYVAGPPPWPWQSIVWPYDPDEYSDMAFAITSGEGPEPPKEPVPDLKWSQPPIEYDPTETEPRFCGWDEVSFTDDPNQWWRIAADDFRCFGSMPIDSIHWWGSYSWWDGDEPPPGDPPIAAWRIGFWTNVPADPTGADPCWSRPEMLLWQIEVPAARVPVERVGIDEHPYNAGFLETCFQYYVDLEPDEVFWQEEFLQDTADDVFWLSIAAIYDPCDMMYVDYPWGWKTRPWSWMDDGVVFEIYDENPQPGMVIDPINNYMYPLEWYESYDLAFELDTDPNWIKWDQPYTGIRHWPHYEDVESWMEWWPEGITHLTVAADDWKCQGPLPVTALAWYGSYLGYQYQPCDPCFVQPRPEQPAYFDVSIWTDVPADPCDQIMPWSHPGEIVWQYDVYDYDEVLVGYDKHPHDPCGPAIPGPHEPVFRYTARIPEEEWFWQSEDEAVYWLSIVAVYEQHFPQYVWGWTNHQHVYNDDAVQAYPGPDKQEWYWNEILDQTGASADLSFTIYTDPYPEQLLDFGDAPDPCYPTLLANDGARHYIGGPWFGGQGYIDPCDIGGDMPDPEPDGQPDPSALGDDNDGNDDEDGVLIPVLVQGVLDMIVFEVSGADPCAGVDAWLDWNGDGDFNDPCELVCTGFLGDGPWGLSVTAPLNSVVGQTFSRWRISSAGGLAPTGLADDGEVEDHEVIIEPPLLDFGDAPDPCYPTWLANNGARHVITGTGPWFGPADDAPDAEVDGQPDPCSLGDDLFDLNDDEDGVRINGFTIGQQGSITFDVSGAGASIPDWVQIWIDWDSSGSWEAGEQVVNAAYSDGTYTVNLTPPAGAVAGTTFLRARISNAGGLSPDGPAPDGEVEDHKVYIEEEPPPEPILKWSQPPVEIEPDLYYGWDEMSIYGGMQIAGDDWLCEDQRPVSDLHWWGSYYGWDMSMPPPGPVPIGFHIGIWTDVPMGDPCNFYPYSHPGRMIWEYAASMAEVNEEPVGMDFHEQHPPDVCFKYDLQLPEEFWFWQEGPQNIYWLTISAIYDVQPPVDLFYWGWKTREHNFNDDAIRILMPTAPMVGEPFMDGEPIWPGWDMAFELTTQECMAPTNPDYSDWTTLAGYPACWCYCKHCNGDAEGCSQFAGQVPVYLLDLGIFLPAFGDPSVTTTPGHPGWCGDFARDAAFAGQVRVYTTDLARFLPNFGAPNPLVPVSSGPGCSGPHVPPFVPNPPGCDTNPLPNTEYNFWTYPASCGANVVTPCQ
jgi:hypothetical protein